MFFIHISRCVGLLGFQCLYIQFSFTFIMILVGLQCLATIPSRDMVVYPSLGLEFTMTNWIKENMVSLSCSKAVPCNGSWYINCMVIHSINCRIPSRQLIRPNDISNGAVIVPINEG